MLLKCLSLLLSLCLLIGQFWRVHSLPVSMACLPCKVPGALNSAQVGPGWWCDNWYSKTCEFYTSLGDLRIDLMFFLCLCVCAHCKMCQNLTDIRSMEECFSYLAYPAQRICPWIKTTITILVQNLMFYGNIRMPARLFLNGIQVSFKHKISVNLSSDTKTQYDMTFTTAVYVTSLPFRNIMWLSRWVPKLPLFDFHDDGINY